MQKRKNYYRIPTKEIHETPANGTYVPDTQLKQLKLYLGVFFAVLAALAVIPRKN